MESWYVCIQHHHYDADADVDAQVARGDLGVEIPMETLTNVQKDIVRRCNLIGKPVIVATQMLESMQKNPRPTRAECTDVANAVLDGADCVMLSGESAKGKYPVQSVAMMRSIIEQVETYAKKTTDTHGNRAGGDKIPVPPITNNFEGMASAVVKASRNLKATCILVLSKTGNTAINVAKFRPDVPVVCFVPSQKTGRLLQVHRGIHPVVASRDLSSPSNEKRFTEAVDYAVSMGFCKRDNTVIIVCYENSTESLSPAVSMRVAKVTSVEFDIN